MSRLLGEAYVAILPETDQFGPLMRAGIDKQVKSYHPDVNVGANLSKADVAKIAAQLKGVTKNVNVGASLDKSDLAKIDSQLKGVTKNVNVGASLDKSDLAKIDSQLKAVTGNVQVGASVSDAALAHMAAQIDTYTKGHTAEVHAEVPLSDLAEINAELQKFLRGNIADVSVRIPPTQLAQMTAAMNAWGRGITPATEHIQLDKNDLAKMQTELDAFSRTGITATEFTNLVKQAGQARAAIEDTAVAVDDLGSKTETALQPAQFSFRQLVNDIIASKQAAKDMATATAAAAAESDTSTSGIDAGWFRIGGFIHNISQIQVPLFSTSMTEASGIAAVALDKILPHFLSTASGIHMIGEAVVEMAAIWVPATIAMGVFAAAAYQDAKQIVGQWKTVQTVMSATNTPMDGLSSGLSRLSQAIKPEIWTAFGTGLVAITQDSGKLTGPLQDIGRLFDTLGAHIDELVTSGGNGFSKFIQGGADDIHELGEAFGNIGKILAVFFESVPGYATILLHLGTDFLGVAANVLQLVQPLLKVGLAVHGAIFYIGLASTLALSFGRSAIAAASGAAKVGEEAEGSGGKLANLGAGFGNLVGGAVKAGTAVTNWGKDLYNAGGMIAGVTGGSRAAGIAIKLLGDGAAAVAAVPIAGWAAVAAVAIGVGLYFAFRHTTDAIQQMGIALVNSIQNSNPNNLFENTTKAVIKTGQAIEALTTGYQKLAKATTAAFAIGPYAPVKGKTGPVGPYGSGTGQGAGPNANPVYSGGTSYDMSEYVDNFQAIAKAALPAASNELAVAKATGSMSNAINVASAAGIKWSNINKATPQQLANINAQLKAYQTAVTYMSNSQGQAASNIAALNVAASNQIKNVQSLNSAWQTYLGVLGGGETAFIGLEQGINQYNTDLKTAGATMTGLSPASLTLRSDFQAVDTAAQSQVSALTTFIAATGGATNAQKDLANKGIKAVIAQMIPLAGSNKSAQAEIVGLAQRANGSLTTWQAVTKWVGKDGAAGAAKTLQQVNGSLASSIQNVVKVANSLTGAMQAQAIQAQDKLVFALVGGTAKMTAFGQALAATNGRMTSAIQTTGVSYYDALIKAGVGNTQAKVQVLAMAKSLGVNAAGLALLTNDMDAATAQQNKLSQSTRNLNNDIKTNAAAFSSLATGPLKLTTNQMSALWANIKQQDIDMVAGKADNAKQAFINFAKNGLGLSSSAAQDLWAKLRQQGLDALANKASTTKDQFVNLAKNGLGLTSQQAGALWNELRLQYLDTVAQKGLAAKNQFIDLAKSGLGLTTSAANTLWNTLKMQYLDTLATKAGETKTAFEGTASQFGLTKTAADNLWNSLHNLTSGSPYSLSVLETLSGRGSISATVSAAGVKISSGATTALGNLGTALKAIGGSASGELIHGGIHGQDSVLRALAPGELVIPSTHAAAHMEQAKREGIPGMALGGTVGGGSSAGGSGGGVSGSVGGSGTSGFQSGANAAAQAAMQGVPTMENAALQFTQEAMGQFAGAVNSAAQAAQAGGPLGPHTAGEMANGRAIFQYLMEYAHMTKIAAAGAIASIWGESTWNPFAQNCVPLTYKVVTNRGILAHYEVQVGDTTPVFNPATGKVEDATILAIPYHNHAPVCVMGNNDWSVICTVDHRWINGDGKLVRAYDLKPGEDKIMVGDGRIEPFEFFTFIGTEDTFCLTTTTGTWTTIADDDDRPLWTGNTDGRGLIGWTPAGTISNAAFSGGLSTQLPEIIRFISTSGDWGVINEMNKATSVFQAANLWGKGVERYGLNDVHSEGLALATSIMNGASQQATQGQANAVAKASQAKPFSAGGTIPEQVIGFGVNSGMPYSFAENGPEYVSPSMSSGQGSMMQGATSYQMSQLIQLMQQQNTILAQMPQTQAKLQQSGLNAGIRRGAFHSGG